MPQAFSNNVDFVVKDPKPTKTPKEPPPEPQQLPAFEPMQIDDYNDPREPNIPTSLNQHNPLALFRLFFTDEIVEKMVAWMNKYTKAHPFTADNAPLRQACSWTPINKREIYTYFRTVIYMGVVVQPSIGDYWGFSKGAADYLKSFISRNVEFFSTASP